MIKEAIRFEYNPLIGSILQGVNDEKFRELIKGNYRIIYIYDDVRVIF